MMYRRLVCLLAVLSLSMTACSDDVQPDPDNGDDVAVQPDAGTPDTDLPDTDLPDAAEPDTDTPDVDTPDTDPPDVGTPDADTGTEPELPDPVQTCLADCNYDGPGWDEFDCDWDGLTQEDEDALGTDPCENDTDGDGLNDFDELQQGTEPLLPDSDGDGLNDADELYYGFDPNNQDTLGDGKFDGDRWIVSACAAPILTEAVEYNADTAGDWQVALPTSFAASYSPLSLTGSFDPKVAAAVFDDPANEVAAFVLSEDASNGSAVSAIQTVRNSINGSGLTLVQESTTGEFPTHDFHTAAPGRYLVRSNSARSARAIRDQLLFKFAPFQAADVSGGLPSSSGNTYLEFRVYVSVTYREDTDLGDRTITTVALAPATKFDTRDKVRFRMDDLTNTTNVASHADEQLIRCTTFRAGQGEPKADFYWVLDQSGSMTPDYDKVRSVANDFFAELANTQLDYRLGVTSMDINGWGGPGRLRPVPGWHTDQATFLAEIAVVEAANGLSGGSEYGLAAAKGGIEWMKSSAAPQALRIRDDAQLITIWMSDEEDNDFQGQALSSNQTLLNTYKEFFQAWTVAFAIVVNDPGSRQNDGAAYREVALATGGGFADLESPDISETIEDIIYAATGLASNYVLPDTPISSTLRVFKNGEWVPRSRDNGFDYFASTNSIAFFGTYRPEPADPTIGRYGDDVSVSYQTFLDTTK